MSETFQNLGKPEFRAAAPAARPADSPATGHTVPEPLGPGDAEYMRTALEQGYARRGRPVEPAEQQQLTEAASDYLAELDDAVRGRVKAKEFRLIYEKFDVTLPDALEVAAIAANRRRARRRLHRQGKI